MFEKFKPYFGNNHEQVPPSNVARGGGVHFSKFIGRELDERLWEDLVERMHITDLRIYGPNDCQWCDGRGNGNCDIHLDENGKVKDIYYVPHDSYIAGMDVDYDGRHPKQGLVLIIAKFIKDFKARGGNDSIECSNYVVEGMTKIGCKFDEQQVRSLVQQEFEDLGKLEWFKLWKIETRMDAGFFHCPYPALESRMNERC